MQKRKEKHIIKQYLIVEDNKDQAEALSKIIKDFDPEVNIFISYSISAALQILTVNQIDLFFLDILLSEEHILAGNGIELGKMIRIMSNYQNTPIIYVTSFYDKINTAVNDVYCYGFLHKPYSMEDVHKLLDDLFMTSPTNNSLLTIRSCNSVYMEIPLSTLIIIEAQGKFMKYYCKDNYYTSRQYTMQGLESVLPYYFKRCHRSFIINQNYFSFYDGSKHTIYLKEHKNPIPVGRNYKSSFII